MRVFGTAAPTDEGLQDVCRAAAPAGQVIVWCNLRQEPYVYINGSPYCLKDRHNPFKNMLNTGILAADVEHAEVFLKMEVLAEARKNGVAARSSVPAMAFMCEGHGRYEGHGTGAAPISACDAGRR